MTEVVVYQLELNRGNDRSVQPPTKRCVGSLCSQCAWYVTDRKTDNGEPLDPICSNPVFSNPRQTLKLYQCKGFKPKSLHDV